MSQFLASRYKELVPYIPGEQPKDKAYIKLNANETSMMPSPKVYDVLKSSRMGKLGYYTDPNAFELREAIAKKYDVNVNEVFAGNGSDEVLAMLFLAFFDENSKITFPDITYGYYQGFAKTFGIDAKVTPLLEDFTVDVDAMIESGRHIVLANPNAPSGFVLSVDEIERMVTSDSSRLVIIDEAYVDYGNETCIPLTKKYNNLIVVHTMSKSKNLAGAHIGYAIGNKMLISDLNDIRAAFNPYNLSDISIAIGTAAIEDEEYYNNCIEKIIESREYLKTELANLGFEVLDSKTNFVFVTHPLISAMDYYEQLKDYGILTRYFPSPRIKNYLRITVGTSEETLAVVKATRQIILKETQSKIWLAQLLQKEPSKTAQE